MLFMIPWFVLIAVVILAVPIAAKLSPTVVAGAAAAGGEGEEEVPMEEYGAVEQVGAVEDFGAEPIAAEPLDDDAFAEFG